MAVPSHGDPSIDEQGEKLLLEMQALNNSVFWNNISFDLARKLCEVAGHFQVHANATALMLVSKKMGGITGYLGKMKQTLTDHVEQVKKEEHPGLFEHQSRRNVRYYNRNNEYFDHGRMIYKEIPEVGEFISPFPKCNWKVLEVRFPDNDDSVELYVDC